MTLAFLLNVFASAFNFGMGSYLLAEGKSFGALNIAGGVFAAFLAIWVLYVEND